MTDVISIGAATADIFIKSEQFIIKDNLLSVIYSSKNEISQNLICSGGGATNSSVSFSRLNLKSACVSLLGKDPLSSYITQDLFNDHVNSDLLIQQDQEKTDFSIILVASDGGRSILTSRGLTTLQEKHLNWSALKDCRWFYLTSLEGNLDLLEKIIGFAAENHIKISLNPGNRELANPSRLIPMLPQVDFLLLNKTESEQLTGLPVEQPRFWSKLDSFGSRIVAVTNGRDGAYVLSSGQKLYSPIINIKPVDETGAGDSFGSAFVAALIYRTSISDALHWGIENSASVVSCLGAKPGLLNLSQIRE